MTFDEWVSDEFGKAIEFDPFTGKSQTSGEIWRKKAKEKLGGYKQRKPARDTREEELNQAL